MYNRKGLCFPNGNVLGISFVSRRNIQGIDIFLPSGTKTFVQTKINNRTKRISLRIDLSRRAAVLTHPRGTSIPVIRNFIQNHSNWLADKLSQIPKRVEFCDGALLPILGKHYVIRHCPESFGNVWTQLNESNGPIDLYVSGMSEHIPRRIKDWLKKKAWEEVRTRSQHYAKILDRNINRITVKDTKSRWGSCSSNGNLSFSWRLILAPDHVLNYVCAHEVAHLVEMNHSTKFWTNVDLLISDWKKSRTWLKQNGNILHSYG